MRSLTASVVIAAALAACHLQAANHVGGGVLGRVVIYRNGVAFYERSATVTNGEVTVQVPRERVDDFLKSLTVVDRATGKPLAVTIPRQQSSDGGSLTMTLETADARDAQVLLTYVTEAPAWKPSYRVVVGKDGKVMLEAWAVVDNTTSEDWKGVLVGVGASSALAFRYDLWSVRQIDRDLLQGEQKFAIAPPTGVSPYAGATGAEELTTLDASEIHGSGKDGLGRSSGGAGSTENTYVLEGRTPSGAATGGAGAGGAAPSNAIRGTVTDSKSGERLAGVTVVATDGKTEVDTIADQHGAFTLAVPPGLYTLTYSYSDATASRSNVRVIANQTTTVNQLLAPGTSEGETITITGAAPIIDQGSTKTGMTVTSDFATNVATGRSFGAAGSATAPRPMEPPPTQRGDDKLAVIASKVKQERRDVVVEVHGAPGNEQAAEARGAAVKNKLVDAGVPASRIHIVPKLEAGGSDSVRVLAVAPATSTEPSAPPSAQSHSAGGDTPVGESHFMAERPMTVRAGSSAMVAMLHGETTGGVVYLYDPISDRGDPRFAFKAVRLDNPTGDTLEPGPVTVYGDGRFIGEGITEPVPPHAAVVVPFALDKQVVVERSGAEQDRIARLVTAQRGVVTAELQHRRDTRFKLTSRLALPSTVYLRHRLEPG